MNYKTAAKRYLESQNLIDNESFIHTLSDSGVSATMRKMKDRPKLMKLMRLIKEGRVKTVIVYKRDRLSRNFYEFVDIIRDFIKHDVEVIYTANNEPPFNDKLSIDAFYGIYAQMEDENIRTHTDDVRRQYPSRIFGYVRKKIDDRVTYEVYDSKRELIKTLFKDFNDISSKDQFMNSLIVRRKGPTDLNRVLLILRNPFYSAHYETDYGYQALPHVEPIISLETFLAVKSRFDKFIEFFEAELREIENLVVITPTCGESGSLMKHRKANPLNEGYFVCRENHRRIAISVDETNELITKTVIDHVKSNSINQAEKVILKRISAENKKLQREQRMLKSKYIDTIVVTSTPDNKRNALISNYLDKIQTLKEQNHLISTDIIALKELESDIKDIGSMSKSGGLKLLHYQK